MPNVNKTVYCSMLVFSADFSEVLLLTKMKGPSFLLNRLCGIGWVVESGETALAAAVRELFEETGLVIEAGDWLHIDSQVRETATLEVFTAVGDIHAAKTSYAEAVIEPVSVHKVADILAADTIAPDTVASDLKYYILAALAAHGNQSKPQLGLST